MDIDIRTLLGRLNPECKRAMEQAAELCVQQTHYNVDIEHLLMKLVDNEAPDLRLVFGRFGIRPDAVRAQLQKSLDTFKRGNGRTPSLAPDFAPLFQEAWLMSSMLLGQQHVRSGTLMLALLEVDRLRGRLVDAAPALLQIPRGSLRDELAGLLQSSPEDAAGAALAAAPIAPAPSAPAVNQPAAPQPAPEAGAMQMPTARRSSSATPSLDQYTVDMTQLARDGAIDPIRGRDGEIRQIIDVLLRRRQNNPILTGEAGVGKTAVVEGFAQRVVQGDVPPALRQVSVRSLDLALLQAGAGVKGEFENRLKSVIAEVKASPTPVILFIDEAHQLIGAGGAEGQGDAANLLKPALARGELRTIAATTWAEYKKYVERDPALARRFQVVKVEEPSEEVAIDMLRGMVETLEKHHGVEIVDDAVREAVKLSHRYITGRQLPDKAISVLDTACARVAIGQNGLPAELESAARDIATGESELRVLRHEAATGGDHQEAIAALSARLDTLRQKHKRLSDKVDEEKHAVMEIVALRRKIADSLRSDAPPADEENDPALLTAALRRLEKGLEALQNDEPMVPVCVDGTMVAEVISGWTGIPVGKMMTDELHTVLNLKEKLAERVVGQDDALDAIARRVRTFRADLDDPGKPVGVFMLVGPSGVGKTETAFALADLLYGGERNVITVNMSEFQEAHTVSSLKGAPPGYVGYGRGGVLTEAVRRRPYSVVLLDEMEKAHPDVLELFFQVFDKGTMEDGEGVQIDFKNTLILLTSNAAQDVITQASQGGRRPDPEELVERLRPELLKQFSPAFLGRLALVPYHHLGDGQIRSIVNLKLGKLARRFALNHHAEFTWDTQVEDAITARCTEVDSGARNIDHILAHAVLPELSRQVLERISMAAAFTAVHMGVGADGAFAFGFEPSTLS
ncbi:type VI secretion system ATPase TssH [Variovorax gossypii]|uniref:Type VI secretion system ATPase TssH n=1 Tax=Variovorax gossypii TaxID=1679495 RepID=A0A3S0GXU5_9BURK|nr:type VI secretion system ATPase TssH [Variovorax gossypii]MDP9606679.1 type VI secretion system protein VasG [Variovorax paradoxus]RTQ31519.1 type VI secretion system ATPase TssH [Variovorax gossypii]